MEEGAALIIAPCIAAYILCGALTIWLDVRMGVKKGKLPSHYRDPIRDDDILEIGARFLFWPAFATIVIVVYAFKSIIESAKAVDK